VKSLNENFVCFAPGWFINDKDAVFQAAWKRFYVAKPRPGEGKGWLTGTQLILMTSAGRLLGGTVKGRDGLAKALDEVLADYAKLPEAERRPEAVEGEAKPQAAPPEGGLVLTIHDRALGRAKGGGYRLPEGDDCGGCRTEAPHGQRSSLWLTRDEVRSLLPADPVKGKTYPFPAKTAKRIWLYGLVPQSLWVVEEMWKPDSARDGELSLTVEEASEASVRMRVHGRVRMTAPAALHTWPDRKFIKNLENRYDARLEGTLVIDQASKQVVRWDMVALGDYAGRWFAGNKGWKEATPEAPLALGFAIERDAVSPVLPPERRRPRSFVHAYIFREREGHYWDPDKWLEEWKRRPKER
jgi:hypothetical protein